MIDDARFAAILADLALGRSLRSSMAAHKVNRRMFYERVDADPSDRERYARAKMEGLEAMAEEILDIADDVGDDRSAIDRARLRVDTRKWLLSKLAPKRYGERVTLAGDEENPIATVDVTDPRAAILGRLGSRAADDGDSEPGKGPVH